MSRVASLLRASLAAVLLAAFAFALIGPLANLALSGVQVKAAVDLLQKVHAGSARVAFSFGAYPLSAHLRA